MVLVLRLLDIVAIQLLNRLPQERHPKGRGLVLVPPEALVEPPDGALAEAPLEVLQEVGRVLVASVPIWATSAKSKRIETRATYHPPSPSSSAAGSGRSSAAPSRRCPRSARQDRCLGRPTGSSGRARGSGRR